METLDGDLDKIHIWSEKWLVKFNQQKNENMILSKHKHLGVIFSNNGFWHDNVDYIVKKSYTRLNMEIKESTNGS